MGEMVLQARSVSKHFGGLKAVNEVDLSCSMGEVHAVIGPNGAGKTTLINLLSGDLKASSGQIIYRGREITHLPAHRISRLGIGRSYQRTNIFPELTCWQNCWLAGQSQEQSSLLFFQPADALKRTQDRVEIALKTAGLESKLDEYASSISYGEQRQLEIAMLLALEPEVLLLDEPLAGMGNDEAIRVIELIGNLAKDHCIVLIEHDMDAIFAVANILTVMVDGVILESGIPATIRDSSRVREAYLGDDQIFPSRGKL